MAFQDYIIVIAVISILTFTSDLIIKKSLGITKTEKITDPSAKKVDRWGRFIIVCFTVFMFLFVIGKDLIYLKGFCIGMIVLSLGFQAFLEWKYLNNSKQFIATLLFLIATVAVMATVLFPLVEWLERSGTS